MGNLAQVRTLLAHGADINTTQQNGWTALMLAARDGHVRVAQYLIAHGADIHRRSVLYNDVDAFMLSVENGSLPLIKLLIARGVDVNETDDTGSTVLMQVGGNGNLSASRQIQIIKILLHAGANINARDKAGDTALSGLKIALRSWYWGPRVRPVVRFLEQQGAK